MCMDGVALNWFANLFIKHPNTDWGEFRTKLMTRFSGTKFRNAHEALGSLFDDGDIERYIEEFEALSALIPNQSEEQMIGMFLRGLQDDVRNWVRTLNPKSCDQAMDFARNVAIATGRAEKKQFQGSRHSGWKPTIHYDKSGPLYSPSSLTKPKTSTNPTATPAHNTTHYPHRSNTQSSSNTKHLSKTDWEDYRRRGLCYRCGQKYTPQHKCVEGQLRVLLLADGEELNDEGEIRCIEQEEEEIIDGECQALEFCGLSDESSSNLRTIKLMGELQGLPALILIDSGASHNFISTKLVTALSLETISIGPLKIRLGDGNRILVTEQCKDTSLKFGDFNCVVDALVYDLGPLDFILGIAWLGRLGDVVFNWQTQVVRFWDNGHQVQLASILSQFASVFQKPQGLPPIRAIEHAINLYAGQGPICVRPYRYPHAQKDEIERQVQEMLTMGIIRVSQSAFSSPVILVKKKDATWRLCIDYRTLNRAIIPDKYPIPIVEELLDELYGSTFFSKIDLKSGFYQVRVRECDVEKTAFRTHDGHYEFLVMPFGLTNAPATFQALMNEIFRPLLRKGVLVFFDDILLYSSTWEQHLHLLSTVLQLLHLHKLVINDTKSSFGIQSVEYLGHILDSKGVSMDPSKIQSVRDWPIPTTVKGVRGFLGLTGYYRKFIQNYGKIAQPLTEITKKDNFHWSLEQQSAFDELKRKMTEAPVLTLPDFSKPFEIECDASGRGIGAVLMQNRKPISYFSKALSDKTLTKSAYEKEIMALALSIQHWRPYLIGREFTVFTDQKSLRHLMDQRITTTDQQNWLAKLMGYQFNIFYKPGKENRAADSLSRIHEGAELTSMISYPQWLDGNTLTEGYETDSRIQKLLQAVTDQPSSHPSYSVINGKLFHKNKLVIPSTSTWIPKLLDEFHSSPSGGHSGFYRTYRRLAAHVYWFGMVKTVKQFVQACDICQRYKSSTLAPTGLLQPLPIPQSIWEDISIDFITGLPRSKGFDTILVVVDRLSKYCHFIPLKHPFTARSLADVFLKEVIRLHGIPKSVLSDRDPLFLSKFWKEIFTLQGSKLRFSSAYHPETDGQTEVVNRSLETYLRCFAADQPKSWYHWIPWAEFWHNTAYHVSTNTTPSGVVYGRPPPTLFQFVPGEVRCEAVMQELLDRDEAIKQLKYHYSRSQATMKSSADKHRRDVEFAVGDWVFLKLRPHRQQSVVRRINQKLSPRFYGPFVIIERVGAAAYKLQLPSSSKIHPVFHVSLLKRAIGAAPVEAELPPGMETDATNLHPEKCIDTRTIKRDGKEVTQWLIQWSSGSIEDSTWEDAFNIQSQYPDFRLEDKPIATEAAIDREQAQEFQPNTVEPKPMIWKEDDEIWEPKLPRNHREIIGMSKTPEIYSSTRAKELYKLLTEGIFIQKGEVWLSLSSTGKVNILISATKFSYRDGISHKCRSTQKSIIRFPKVVNVMDISNLKIRIKLNTTVLSLDVTYAVRLVFKFCNPIIASRKLTYVNLKYKMGDKTSHAYFATHRHDDSGWMMIELFQFIKKIEDTVFEVSLESFSPYYCESRSIYVQGIEFKAIEKVDQKENEKLKEVQQGLKSNLNIDQRQQLSTDKIAEENSYGETVKKHITLSAKEFLYNPHRMTSFHFEPSDDSSFEDVTELLQEHVFRIKYKIEIEKLSPLTEYACYLVFKLTNKCRGLYGPVKVRDILHKKNKQTKFIYFRSPSQLNQHDGNWVPEQRKDGWMEVMIWEFNSKYKPGKNIIPMHLQLITYEGTMAGLIVMNNKKKEKKNALKIEKTTKLRPHSRGYEEIFQGEELEYEGGRSHGGTMPSAPSRKCKEGGPMAHRWEWSNIP
ncbi:uncharacterized protein [Rutidosis leptorrhynchoides]|uniref:uncharacterized protein n=1 Tax=Rutidosis leptorrhynchoides TaxID=125765 RepID=UPI003A9A5AE3